MARSGSTRFRFLALTAVAALAAGVAGVPAASAASTKPPAGVSMEGTGPQPKGLGLFSSAALGQEYCADNGRMWFATEGTGPYCVNPWPEGKNNGGATASGVTATEVKVVVYSPQATSDQFFQGIKDTQAVYQYASDTFGTYQTWGRKPVITMVGASGTDEAAQRADALKVIAMKPFMVIDVLSSSLGAPVFSSMLAQAKILVASSSTTPEAGEEQSPYRWNYGADQKATVPLTAAFVGRSLAGEKAKFAGDKAMTSKKRSFGLIYAQDKVDLAEFEKLLKENGATLTKAVGYNSIDPTTTKASLPTLVSQLKDAGVTSVIVLADPTTAFAPMLDIATTQEFFPEWIITGFGYTDFDVFGRTFNQEQMKHAFGIGALTPFSTPAPGGVTEASLSPFIWYWGSTSGKANDGGFVNPFVYRSIHYAGPTLTAANVKKGLFSAPVETNGTAGGATGFGNSVGLPYPEYALFGFESAMIWWNPTQTGPGNAVGTEGTGKFMYLSEGKRFRYDDFPTSEPKFFDASASSALVPLATKYTGDVIPPKTPCTNCPSQGGTGTAP